MDYKSLQIIKHALQSYVKRENASEKEIDDENRVLKKITEMVDELKERYGIK